MNHLTPEEKQDLAKMATKLGVDSATRHVFLCIGPNCCPEEKGLAAWEELKKQIKDHKLDQGNSTCFRTKVGCLRVCKNGPIATVYPEGTWYAGLTKDKVPEFVQQHLQEGKPVEGWIFKTHPLPNQESNSSARDS